MRGIAEAAALAIKYIARYKWHPILCISFGKYSSHSCITVQSQTKKETILLQLLEMKPSFKKDV
jgi:hypothetical protein